MESRQKILELVSRFEILPAGHQDELRSWLADLNFALNEIFGPDSNYIQYLKYIQFQPEVIYVTDNEREGRWKQGVTQVDNLLHVILNDPKLSDRIILNPDVIVQEDASSEDRVQQSLEEFKESAARQMLSIVAMDGAIEEPPHVDDAKSPRLLDQGSLKQEDGPVLAQNGTQNAMRILCVAGSNALINDEVQKFLSELPAEVMPIPGAVGQESLIDRLSKCTAAQFAVFILSADYHYYSKSQRPVDGAIMASQEAVFELGYLVAKFSRRKIVVLYEEIENFMRPTEFFDLFYVPVTANGAWKNEVLRRIKGNQSIETALNLSSENRLNA